MEVLRMLYVSLFLLIIIIVFLFFILRRTIYYQKLIEESVKEKDYGNALLYSQIIGNWWLMNYFAEKIEKEFVDLNTINATRSIKALIDVRDNKRVRRILFNKARERADSDVLLKWFWKEGNKKAE